MINTNFRRTYLSSVIFSLLAPNIAAAAPVDWIDSTGFWDVAGNWSSSPGLPGAGDDAVLNVAGTHTITVRSTGSPFSVNSINTNGGDETLAITGGTLTLVGAGTATNATGNSTLNAFTQSGGTVTGAGNLTVTGSASFANGTHSGSGTTTLQGNTSLGGAGLDLDSGRILRNEGTLAWTGGNMNLNATGNGGAGRIDNINGAVWNAQSNTSISALNFGDIGNLAGFPAFNNAGTFRKSASTGTTSVNVAFNNTGTVDVQTGTASLGNGGTNSGNLTVASGAELQFSGGTHELNSGTVFNIDGTLAVTAGTVDSNVAASIAGNTRVAGGVLALNDSWQTGGFNQSGGTVTGAGNLTVTGSASFANGTHSGSGTTTLQGNTSLGGGGLSLDSGRILRNEGTLAWTGGNMNLNSSGNGGAGRIDNINGAVWNAQSDNSIFASTFADVGNLAGFPAFNNAGTFRKNGGTGTTSVSVAFNNTGTVDVQTGVVSLSGPATVNGVDNQGIINVDAGAVFETNSSNKVIANHGAVEGSGTFGMQGSGNSLQNSGFISAGNDAAIGGLTIDLGNSGTFEQLAGGVLDFSLESLTSFDTLSILGNNSSVDLAGTLKVSSFGGYNPDVGDFFTIMTFDPGSLTGAFDNIVVSGFNPGINFQIQYLNDSIVLGAVTSAVPLPGSIWFMLSGLTVLLARRSVQQSKAVGLDAGYGN